MHVLSVDILKNSRFPKWDQEVAVKIEELCNNLCTGQSSNGSWLSFVRNEVNYRHIWGAWYPYRDYKPYYNQLFDDSNLWLSDPMLIELQIPRGKELQRFQRTCHFIIALCRVLVEDMEMRCSKGKSFHQFGSKAFLNLTGQTRAGQS